MIYSTSHQKSQYIIILAILLAGVSPAQPLRMHDLTCMVGGWSAVNSCTPQKVIFYN
jgi:hypothetical protein